MTLTKTLKPSAKSFALSLALVGAAAVSGLFALPGAGEAQDAAFTDAQRAAIREEARKLLAEEPQLVLQALQALEEARRQQEEEAATAALSSYEQDLLNDGYSYVGGNLEGDITLVEFLDYRCGFCKRAHKEVEDFVAADGNVRLVVKEFPVLGPDSERAGLAASAAMKQGPEKYKAFHDGMMTHRGALDERAVFFYAEQAGLDVEKLKADMEDPAVKQGIGKNYEIAQALQINGTPAFIMGDEIIRGYVPADALKGFAEKARASN
ncbi:MAG: DsbA family protein [Neomegalonema sp.]|nr:DsbA family protein [Neomegalonema sp.]